MQSQLKIYQSSAGSGKTYTLAKSYVKILILNPNHYRNILAITFTKKATAEMKNRILLFLEQIKTNTNPKLVDSIIVEIKQEYNTDVSKTIHNQADKAIQYILHDYSHFQVTTIDSFFQHIIRSFAKELKLPIGTQVELDTDKVLKECIQKLLESYEYADEDVAQWLEQFVYNNIDNDKGWKIETSIARLGKELLKEDYVLIKNNLEDIKKIDFNQYHNVAKQQQEIIDNYKIYLQEQATIAENIIKENNINTVLFSNDTIRAFIQNAKNSNLESIVRITKMLNGEMALFSKATMKSHPDEVEKITAIWHTALYEPLNNILNYHLKHAQPYHTAQSVLKNIYAMALLDELSNQLSEYRNKENKVLISDAPYFISKIASEEATPFIYEKISTFIQYILIDEFQDTSALQWKSLLPIVIEILAKGNGLSLIVGDAKQSIYRWRGGKMELILHQINNDLKAFKTLKQEIVLDSNHRSCPTIISFNNAIFAQISNDYKDLPLLQDAYWHSEQKIVKTTNDGYVQCKWLDADENEEQNIYPIVADEIRTLHQRYNWKDIAILLRTNKEAIDLANYFQENATDIPFVSGESLLIANHLSVKLIVATLEYILFSNTNFYAYKLEHIFCQYFKIANTNDVLTNTQNHHFQSYLQQRNINIISLQQLTLLDTVATLLHTYAIDKESNMYVLRLLDEIHQFIEKNNNQVLSFLNYWKEKKQKISILPTEDTDAVQIMTIHKSKGLEFPVVLMPFVDWSLHPKAGTIFWTENTTFEIDNPALPISYVKALDDSDFSNAYQHETQISIVDNINNLYVAFTRAENELYLYSKNPKENKNNTTTSDVKNVSDLLRQSLMKSEMLNAYFIDSNTYQLGSKPLVQKKQYNSFNTNFNFSNIISDNQYMLTVPAYSDDSIKKGEIIHELAMHIDDEKKIETKLVAIKEKYQLDEQSIAVYKKIHTSITNLLHKHQMLKSEYKYYYEKDLIFNNAIIRADLAIEAPNEIFIIDYKTGQEEPKHQQQLLMYKNAYAKIFSKPTKAYLLYSDLMYLKEV